MGCTALWGATLSWALPKARIAIEWPNWEGHCSLLTYTLSFHHGNAPIFPPFLENHPCVLEMRWLVQKGSMFAPQPHPEHVPNSLTESQNFYMIRADGCSDSHSRGDVPLVTCWWGKHENSWFKISVKQVTVSFEVSQRCVFSAFSYYLEGINFRWKPQVLERCGEWFSLVLKA